MNYFMSNQLFKVYNVSVCFTSNNCSNKLVGREIGHNHHIQGFIHYEKRCGNITILYALRKSN